MTAPSKWFNRPRPVIMEHAGLQARGFLGDVLIPALHRASWRFRQRRLARFDSLFPDAEYEEVLDVGGTFSFWQGTERKITIVNPLVSPTTEGNLRSIVGDGRALPFPDKSFRLAFSNSAIEHMSKHDMQSFAAEMMRVGEALYCQTPNRWFPYDTHYVALFWHWWPGLLHNYFIARYLTGWGWLFRPDRKHVEDWANEVNLLCKKELQTLFPGCTIEEEKVLGMTKSFIVTRLAK